MNFDLSEEQSLLQSSVQRFIQNQYDLERRRKYLVEPGGFSAANYETLAELGLLMLPFSEERGGLGADPVDIMVACEAIGPGLVAEPLFASAIFSGAILNQIDGTDALAEALCAGETRCAIAHAERKARFSLHYVEMKASAAGDGYTLDGQKTFVLNGDEGVDLIVLARTSGAAGDKTGLSLFHVAAGAAGLDIKTYRAADLNLASEIDFRSTPASLLGPLDGGFEIFEMAVAEATFALCAEGVGIMQAMFDETLEYVKQRKQFGVPIGSFQVIQHRMSDCYMALEQCRSMTLKAALADRSDRAAFLKTIAGAKALISDKALMIGHEAIQFHGGMGVTDELVISHYHKRLQMISTLFGDVKTHLARYEAAA